MAAFGELRPTRLSRYASRNRITPSVAINVEKLYNRIEVRVNRVVGIAGEAAWNIARAKAPVRRVFYGKYGRGVTRRLTSTVGNTPAGFSRPGFHAAAYSQAWENELATKYNVRTTWNRLTNRTYRASGQSWSRTASERIVTIAGATYNAHGEWDQKSGTIIHAHTQNMTARGLHELSRSMKTGSLMVIGHDTEGNLQATLGGHLRASVELEDTSTTGNHIRRTVRAGGPTAPYAKYVEFGTRHARAQPFLRPALKHVEQTYASRMRSALRGLAQESPG